MSTTAIPSTYTRTTAAARNRRSCSRRDAIQRPRGRPERGQEREPVPVADRRAKACKASVVLVERGDHLPGQRPQAGAADQGREAECDRPRRASNGSADGQPEHGKGQIGEAAVEVVPRAIGRRRPRDRDPVPDDEPGEEAHEQEPRAVELGHRQTPRQRRSTGRGGRDDRSAPDPGERRVASSRRRRRSRRRAGHPLRRGAQRRLSACRRRYQRATVTFQAYKPFTWESRKHHRRRRDWGTMAPRGEGRLVPIPPRVRALAPPALPVRIFGLALLLALALMVGAKPAAAKPPCWKQVVQDWFEDSRIDRTYPRHCYSDALKNVPNDVKDYSSFEEDIQSALQRVNSRPVTLGNRQRRLDTAGEADAASWRLQTRPSRNRSTSSKRSTSWARARPTRCRSRSSSWPDWLSCSSQQEPEG